MAPTYCLPKMLGDRLGWWRTLRLTALAARFHHLGLHTTCIPSDRAPPEFRILTLGTGDIRPADNSPGFGNPEPRGNRGHQTSYAQKGRASGGYGYSSSLGNHTPL